MKTAVNMATVLVCIAVAAAEKPKTVPAWRNTVDKSAAENAMCAYTSNVIRCEWAGEDPKVANLMPANLAFQFAVVGDSDVTNRVQKILHEVADSIRPKIRKDLEEHGLLNSTLQWIFRSCRPGVTNWQEYIKPKNHPAAFLESDFDLDKMKHFASLLTPDQIPLPVTVTFGYVEDVSPLGRAEPGVDYPEILPEENFKLPFGCAIVCRAPERKRKIRLKATTWPFGNSAEYVWQRTGWVGLFPWRTGRYKTPERGYADVIYDTSWNNPRVMDIMVFVKLGNGIYGPPTIVSVYRSPYDQRKYGKKGLESITYLKSSPYVPYDISPIWTPREWKDVFYISSNGKIISFERILPGRLRGDSFSAIGELIHSTSSSGLPLKTSKVEYFIAPDSGNLSYREVGNEITYRLGESPYRRSGE